MAELTIEIQAAFDPYCDEVINAMAELVQFGRDNPWSGVSEHIHALRKCFAIRTGESIVRIEELI